MSLAIRVKYLIDCRFILLVPDLLEPRVTRSLFASDMLASDVRGEA